MASYHSGTRTPCVGGTFHMVNIQPSDEHDYQWCEVLDGRPLSRRSESPAVPLASCQTFD